MPDLRSCMDLSSMNSLRPHFGGPAATALALTLALPDPALAQLVCISPQTHQVDIVMTQEFQRRFAGRDPRAMGKFSGVWSAQEPNWQGGTVDVKTTLNGDGTLLFEKNTCVSMQGLGTSCPRESGQGYWAAATASEDIVFMSTNVTYSDYTGHLIRGECHGRYVRMSDQGSFFDCDDAQCRSTGSTHTRSR